MENEIKKVTYRSTNTYETLNKLNSKTKNVWIVFHGIGFLSRFFLRYFDELNTEENYIIAPQAPSKYYLNGEYKHVGASWLTKENTELETKNLIAYINAMLTEEKIPAECSIFVLGFSQGVSIAMRYLAKTQFKCRKLILYAGGIPNELKKTDFNFLLENKTKIISIIGDTDEYLTPERLTKEHEKLTTLFGGTHEEITFKGGHEVKKEIINKLS